MNPFRFAAAALVCAGVVFAQEPAAGSAAASSPEAKTPVRKVWHSLTGTVVSVDESSQVIIVKNEDTLSMETGVKVLSGKKKLTLADIKPDMRVKISFKLEKGKKVAAKIAERAEEKPAEASPAAKKRAEASPAMKKKAEASPVTEKKAEASPATEEKAEASPATEEKTQTAPKK